MTKLVLVSQPLSSERCSRGQRILNECNWCKCDTRTWQYRCETRTCSAVDMFGHFNDAIREYEVGMEGHGSWRSTRTACEPRVHYQRAGLLCVCADDGTWPSPVCRDLFRVLHEVEVTHHTRPSALHSCSAGRLYLYGCNVCVCPTEGKIDLASCTHFNCTQDDPVLKDRAEDEDDGATQDITEIYAECELNRKYLIGCQKCVCLKNNRLLCDKCETAPVGIERTSNKNLEKDDYCTKAKGVVFKIDCNICICAGSGLMYCTTKRCLKDHHKSNIEISKSVDLTMRSVDAPIDPLECEPFTKYNIDCNTCYCTMSYDKKKTLSCTFKNCGRNTEDKLDLIKKDCVENSVYKMNCLICRCDRVDGVKRESCLLDPVCSEEDLKKERTDLNLANGYCEPTRYYQKDCNACRCLDGKVASCTANLCPARDRPIYVDVVPVKQPRASKAPCVPDHMYRVDCNLCFCLRNGNMLCTTAKCD